MSAEWVAAIVGAVAAGVVAWQSWETRKNAKAAAEAARAANDALELARTEEGHTRTLIAEAVKARIDQNTPSVILVAGKPLWPPVSTLAAPDHAPEELHPGTAFTMPRDADRQVFVRQPLTIYNNADQPVELRCYEALFDQETDESVGEVFTIPARSDLKGYFVVQRSLGEWVDIAEKREQGDPGPEHRFQLTYTGQSDTGAIDRWYVQTGGIPVERIPNERGGWRIAELASHSPYNAGVMTDVMAASVFPREREYWLSRTNNQQLD